MPRWPTLWPESLTWDIPELLVLAAALPLAVWYWRRHRLASTLAIAGVILLLSHVAVELWVYVQLEIEELPDEATYYKLITLPKRMWVLLTGLKALGLACLIAAVFVNRSRPAERRNA